MSAAMAMLIDSYRELNARKMFWITLMLSILAVSVLALVGVTADGHFKFFIWETPIDLPGITLNTLLKSTFVSFGIGLWLTWAATILALISTASIIPDFVSGGAIDLVLCKPIARLKLFLLKYVYGLLFVALQVAVFTFASFVIIGVRTGTWSPGLFLAVPLVVTFFSYLFCVCALVGLVTRSTVASILTTLLFWLMLFAFNFADGFLSMPRAMNELYVEGLERRVADIESRSESTGQLLQTVQKQLDEARDTQREWRKWHGLILGAKTVLPKTEDTIKLLERTLIEMADLGDPDDQPDQPLPFMSPEMRAAGVRAGDVLLRIEENMRARSAWWVIGTSLLFEAVVLGLCCWIFLRRDF